jgi:hypothetical protein
MDISNALIKSQPVIITVPSGQKGLLLNNQSAATIKIRSLIREVTSVLPGLALTSPVKEGEQLEFTYSGALGTTPNIDISFSETDTNLAYIPIYNNGGSMQVLVPSSQNVVTLAYKTNVTQGTLYQGAVDKFQALSLFLYSNITGISAILTWYGANALQGLQFSERFDIDAITSFNWQFPVRSPYVDVTIYSAGTTTYLIPAALYGIYGPAPEPVLQYNYSLVEISTKSIDPSKSYTINLPPYKGAANIDIYNTTGTPTSITIDAKGPDGHLYGRCYYNNSTTGIIHDYIALPPHINVLTITNLGSTQATYYGMITPI